MRLIVAESLEMECSRARLDKGPRILADKLEAKTAGVDFSVEISS